MRVISRSRHSAHGDLSRLVPSKKHPGFSSFYSPYVRSVVMHTYNHHAAAISILPTSIDVSSANFKENSRQMGELMAKMNEMHAKIEDGGSTKAREKHIARGKMLPREYELRNRLCEYHETY